MISTHNKWWSPILSTFELHLAWCSGGKADFNKFWQFSIKMISTICIMGKVAGIVLGVITKIPGGPSTAVCVKNRLAMVLRRMITFTQGFANSVEKCSICLFLYSEMRHTRRSPFTSFLLKASMAAWVLSSRVSFLRWCDTCLASQPPQQEVLAEPLLAFASSLSSGKMLEVHIP